VVVGIGCLTGFMAGPGQSYALAEFTPHYEHAWHLTRAAVSGLFALATLAAGLLALPAGRLVDRYGSRRALTVTAVLFGLAAIVNGLVSTPWGLLGALFLVRFLGMGVLTLIPNTLIPQWFVRLRGRALSVAALGGVVGVAVIPSVNLWLMRLVSWRGAWELWGLGILVTLVPLGAWLVRDTPEHLGLEPDGRAAVALAGARNASPTPTPDWALRDMVRLPVFWRLLVALMVSSTISTGLIYQIFSVLARDGISAPTTAQLLGLLAVMGLVGTLGTGWWVDRWMPERVWAVAFGVMTVELVVLRYTTSVAAAALFIALFGLAQTMGALSSNALWPAFFGRRHLGSIRGVVLLAGVLGSALGPALFGWAVTAFHTYRSLLDVLIALPPLVGLMIWHVRSPQHGRPREPGSRIVPGPGLP
jgi:MFS family permease